MELQHGEEESSVWQPLSFRVIWEVGKEGSLILKLGPHMLDTQFVIHWCFDDFNIPLEGHLLDFCKNTSQKVFVNMLVRRKVDLHYKGLICVMGRLTAVVYVVVQVSLAPKLPHEISWVHLDDFRGLHYIKN